MAGCKNQLIKDVKENFSPNSWYIEIRYSLKNLLV